MTVSRVSDTVSDNLESVSVSPPLRGATRHTESLGHQHQGSDTPRRDAPAGPPPERPVDRRGAAWRGRLVPSCACRPLDARDDGSVLRCEHCGRPFRPAGSPANAQWIRDPQAGSVISSGCVETVPRKGYGFGDASRMTDPVGVEQALALDVVGRGRGARYCQIAKKPTSTITNPRHPKPPPTAIMRRPTRRRSSSWGSFDTFTRASSLMTAGMASAAATMTVVASLTDAGLWGAGAAAMRPRGAQALQCIGVNVGTLSEPGAA
jgi:hypothetical protein